jgi:hypothetical protein
VVQLLLFLGTFCLFFFFPVHFRIYYRKIAWDDILVLELSFLHGLVKRKQEKSFFNPEPSVTGETLSESGQWFFFHKRQKVVKKSKPSQKQKQPQPLEPEEFFDRLRHFGLGVTLLTYFLSGNYPQWLIVAEDLERRGKFQRFFWSTRFGIGEPALTAGLYGLLWALKATLTGIICRTSRFRNKPILQIVPDFKQARFDMVFDCIFSVKLGYIIIAALIVRYRFKLLRWMKGGVGIE